MLELGENHLAEDGIHLSLASRRKVETSGRLQWRKRRKAEHNRLGSSMLRAGAWTQVPIFFFFLLCGDAEGAPQQAMAAPNDVNMDRFANDLPYLRLFMIFLIQVSGRESKF